MGELAFLPFYLVKLIRLSQVWLICYLGAQEIFSSSQGISWSTLPYLWQQLRLRGDSPGLDDHHPELSSLDLLPQHEGCIQTESPCPHTWCSTCPGLVPGKMDDLQARHPWPWDHGRPSWGRTSKFKLITKLQANLLVKSVSCKVTCVWMHCHLLAGWSPQRPSVITKGKCDSPNCDTCPLLTGQPRPK